jgi:hypothetical protein
MLLCNVKSHLTPEGSLEVKLPGGFCEAVARITPWSKGFETCEIRFDKAIEQPLWSLEMFPRATNLAPSEEVCRFVSDIPTEICSQIRCFRFGQCVILRWLARYQAARDLWKGNSRLLWLLTAAVYDSSVDEDEIPGLLQQKQVVIMGRIIKPASRSAVRMLRKVEIATGDLAEARVIIRALKKPHIRKIVTHLHSISTNLLKTISDNPDLALSPVARFLAEKLGDPDCNPLILSRHISDTLEDIRRMAEVLGIGNPDQDIERCHSIEKLDKLRDRWVDRANRDHGMWLKTGNDEWLEDSNLLEWLGLSKEQLKQYAEQDWAFPEPPFPESKEVRAIRSIHELIGESRIQKNCVATYAPEIMDGEAFVYKVLRPHRATLGLRLRADGWERGDFKLSCNRVPGPEVKRVVDEWFSNNKRALAR